MAKVMLRENSEGKIFFYVAKKDMEEIIESLEFSSEEEWGGDVELTNGETWNFTPIKKSQLPCEVMAKRVSD